MVSTAFLAERSLVVCVHRRYLGLYVNPLNTSQTQILWLTMCDILTQLPEVSIPVEHLKPSNPLEGKK